jgi:carbon-monoxide dehydrogenase iron sulfur subunit
LACSIAHSKSKSLLEAIYEKNPAFPRVILEQFEDGTIPIHCRHCEDAPCIAVCPTQAMARPDPDGPVVLNISKCIACQACIIVCPFGVIQRGSDGKSLLKCDLCIGRLREGDDPACVEACPTRTIKFLPVEDVNADKRKAYLGRYKVAIQTAASLAD